MSISSKLKQYGVTDVEGEAIAELKEMCSNKEKELTEAIKKQKIELAKKIIMSCREYEISNEDEFSKIQQELEQLKEELYDVKEFNEKL